MTTNSLNNECLNDFTVTSGTGGVERTTTAINTTNAANSAATIKAQVAGTSSGDAKLQALISGGQTWSWGLDNSDSDALVFSGNASLGTTNVKRIDTSGVINYPLQSAFLAYLNGTVANKTGAGTSYTLGTDALTEVFDQNSDFNVNGTFTAPITGRYHLSGQVLLAGWTAAVNTYFRVSIITSNRSLFIQRNRPSAGSIWDTSGFTDALFDMDTGDTGYVTVVATGEAGDTVDIAGTTTMSYFCGYLAC